MNNIPTSGDRILRGKSLEDPKKEVGETENGDDTEPDKEDNSSKGGQKKFMQNWLRRPPGHQAREGRQGQTEVQLQRRANDLKYHLIEESKQVQPQERVTEAKQVTKLRIPLLEAS